MAGVRLTPDDLDTLLDALEHGTSHTRSQDDLREPPVVAYDRTQGL